MDDRSSDPSARVDEDATSSHDVDVVLPDWSDLPTTAPPALLNRARVGPVVWAAAWLVVFAFVSGCTAFTIFVAAFFLFLVVPDGADGALLDVLLVLGFGLGLAASVWLSTQIVARFFEVRRHPGSRS